MTGRVFLDTNVLVYADDLDAGRKRDIARDVLRRALVDATGVLSTQVLQEFFVIATRKLDVDAETARRKLELLAGLDVVRIEADEILAAVDLHRLHGLSLWDALVVRTAATAGCERLLSEDLTHGRVVAGVRIENPFQPQEA